MDTRSYKTTLANDATANKQWLVVDATDQTLGRFSSKVAAFLRGKHKTNFTPHSDAGDHVIVVNAEKIRLSGKKMTDKLYERHTGYPGGLISPSAGQVLAGKNPERVVIAAIRGMLPKNNLRDEMMKKLKLFAGTEHPHTSQQPEVLEC